MRVHLDDDKGQPVSEDRPPFTRGRVNLHDSSTWPSPANYPYMRRISPDLTTHVARRRARRASRVLFLPHPRFLPAPLGWLRPTDPGCAEGQRAAGPYHRRALLQRDLPARTSSSRSAAGDGQILSRLQLLVS